MANLMDNGKSKCVNALTIIDELIKQNAWEDFLTYCSSRKATPNYLKMAQELHNLIGLEGFENFDAIEKELKKKWAKSFVNYLSELYPKLIAYVGEWYKKVEQEKSGWEQAIEKLNWEVEALCELKQFEIAAAWIKQHEEKLIGDYEKNYNGMGYRATSVPAYFMKFLGLKFFLQRSALNSRVPLLISDDEKMNINWLSDVSTATIRHISNRPTIKEEKQIACEQRLFYSFLSQWADYGKQNTAELQALNRELGNTSNTPIYRSYDRNTELDKLLIRQYSDIQVYLMLLRRVYLAERENQAEVVNALDRLSNFIRQNEFNTNSFLLRFILAVHQEERSLVKGSLNDNWKSFASRSDYPLLEEHDIDNVLCRFEVNKIILLFFNNEFEPIWKQYFHEKVDITRKKNFESVRIELQVLRLLTFFELTVRYKNHETKLIEILQKKQKEGKNIYENFDIYLQTQQRNLGRIAKEKPQHQLAKEVVLSIRPYQNISRMDEWKKGAREKLQKKGVLDRSGCQSPLDRLLLWWIDPEGETAEQQPE